MKELYYVLMKNNLGNTKQCKTLIKHQMIKVNNLIETNPKYLVKDNDVIIYNHHIINNNPFIYYLLNKPKGYICANHDNNYPCVIDLVDNHECYCVGRLDKDTTGLLLITNDLSLSKKLLLPDNHVPKTYLVTVKNKLEKSLIELFNQGIIIDKDVTCHSSKLEIIDDYHCKLTIDEGKYHQVKKMFLSVNNQVTELHRISFGNLKLDESLLLGQYRSLTKLEINELITY